jgi:membrane protease YdiL (CAAX protease family)
MHFTGMRVSGLPYIVNALIVSAIVLAILLLLLRIGGDSFKKAFNSLGFGRTDFKRLLPGIVISVALLLMYLLLGFLLNAKVFLAKDWHLNLIGLFLTGGLTEEMLFRGYFFGSLRRKMSFRKASLISAIFFTLAHLVMFTYMDWPIALLSTLLAIATSVPFAFLYEKGNNTVWSPAIVHATIRTVGLVITTDENHFPQFSMLWIVSCMVLPYIVLMFYKDFRTIWAK